MCEHENCKVRDQGLSKCVQCYHGVYGHKVIDNRNHIRIGGHTPNNDIDYQSYEITESEIEASIQETLILTPHLILMGSHCSFTKGLQFL